MKGPVLHKSNNLILDSYFRTSYLCSVNQEDKTMEVKDILRNLRGKNHLTQEQMAERIGVTRHYMTPTCPAETLEIGEHMASSLLFL